MKYQELPCIEIPRSAEAVDPERYFAANPDVKEAGVDAVQHFVRHGRQEGREQLACEEPIRELREAKIERLKFNRLPVRERKPGDCAHFITRESMDRFEIPDVPPVSSNQYQEELINEFRNHPEKLFLDVGAGFRRSVFSNVINTEIYPSISTDVVCLGEELPFEDEQFDKVISFAVLEHTRRPWEVAAEMIRVLKPGGELLIDYPFLQPVHGYPHHYFNATPKGNASLFESSCDIDELSVDPLQSPIFALTWILHLWAQGLDESDAARFRELTVGDLLALPAAQQLDRFYCRNLDSKVVLEIPAGSTVKATKR